MTDLERTYLELIQKNPKLLKDKYVRYIEAIGFDTFVGLCEHYGGRTIVVPPIRELVRPARDVHIRYEHFVEEASTSELSKKYGLNQATICGILRNMDERGLISWLEDTE